MRAAAPAEPAKFGRQVYAMRSSEAPCGRPAAAAGLKRSRPNSDGDCSDLLTGAELLSREETPVGSSLEARPALPCRVGGLEDAEQSVHEDSSGNVRVADGHGHPTSATTQTAMPRLAPLLPCRATGSAGQPPAYCLQHQRWHQRADRNPPRWRPTGPPSLHRQLKQHGHACLSQQWNQLAAGALHLGRRWWQQVPPAAMLGTQMQRLHSCVVPCQWGRTLCAPDIGT